MEICAVIFDMDGTLVDTMPIHYHAYRTVLGELDIPLTREHFDACAGGKAHEVIPKLIAGYACALSPAEIHQRKLVESNRLLDSEALEILPTAHLLPLMHQRVKLGLASSGSRKGIETILKRMNWAQYFQTVLTAEDVTRGKPDPEVFLKAAASLGVDPTTVLVFEDTKDGAEAARRAGMQIVEVRSGTSCSPENMRMSPGGIR